MTFNKKYTNNGSKMNMQNSDMRLEKFSINRVHHNNEVVREMNIALARKY